jgi:hypothetical protein
VLAVVIDVAVIMVVRSMAVVTVPDVMVMVVVYVWGVIDIVAVSVPDVMVMAVVLPTNINDQINEMITLLICGVKFFYKKILDKIKICGKI